MRITAVIVSLFLSLAACAQENPTTASAPAAVQYEAGVHYDVIEIPVKTITPGKIEVTEVFWYGCGHCYSFEPILESWEKSLADDVELVRSPAIWRSNMEAHARIFYTAKALGILEETHIKVFEAMHRARKSMTDKAEIQTFFQGLGVDGEKFEKTFTSFSISSQVQQAGARARSFMITGTPEMIVDGRFRITAKKAGGQPGMVKVAEYLIQQVRDKKL